MNDLPVQPAITSFVIRFVHTPPNQGAVQPSLNQPLYRGTIRHIQTDSEIAFIHWEDAVSFIQSFVPLDPSE